MSDNATQKQWATQLKTVRKAQQPKGLQENPEAKLTALSAQMKKTKEQLTTALQEGRTEDCLLLQRILITLRARRLRLMIDREKYLFGTIRKEQLTLLIRGYYQDCRRLQQAIFNIMNRYHG